MLTEAYEILLYCLRQYKGYTFESAYHTVLDEEGWTGHVGGVQKTGILSSPIALSKRSAEFLAVNLLAS